MTSSQRPTVSFPFEEGFLLTLLALAGGGLLWLFLPFLPGLFLAMLLASSTYPLYRRMQRHFRMGSDKAAVIMTVLIFFLVVTPIIYLMAATGLRLGEGARQFQSWLAGFQQSEAMVTALGGILERLPLPDHARAFLLDQALLHKETLGEKAAWLLLFLFRGITDNSLAFLASLVLVLFALFFFYRDGPALVRRIKILTPLANRFDDLIFNRFSSLASVLTLSTLGIALLQGLSFSLVTAFMGLPWFYLGVAMATASLIPVVGGLLVWGPLSYTLYWNGHTGAALFLALWGGLVIGFAIDNLLRPVLIRWLAGLHPCESDRNDLGILDHTLFVTLATFGGLIHFGILGLLFGPMCAAMGITIFDVYQMKYSHLLDHS